MLVQSRGLRDKYCIVGVGETEYSRASGRTTRAMAVEAIRKAILDAGLKAADVDGMLDYQGGDSTLANSVASDLGIRFNFYMDVMGGGSSTEALVGLAMGAIEAGMCNTVAIYRSMNGYSEFRIGGTGARAAQPVRGLDLAQVPYGMRSAGQNFAPTFMRHMYEYGTTSEQVAHVRGRAQQARLAESEGAHEAARDGAGRRQFALGRQAAAPARLLPGDRQRDVHHRDVGGARAKPPTTARVHHGRGRPGVEAAARLPLGSRAHLARGGLLRQGHHLPPGRDRPRRRAHHRVVRRVHVHDHAPARGVRLLQEGRGRGLRVERHHRARRQAARTTPPAATSARATRTACRW
jgi:hypothetical protein